MNKVDWSKVWKEFNKWFNKQDFDGTSWRRQQLAIQRIIEAQLTRKP